MMEVLVLDTIDQVLAGAETSMNRVRIRRARLREKADVESGRTQGGDNVIAAVVLAVPS